MSGPSFIEEYGNSDSDERVDIMLNYFQEFPSIIEGQRKILVLKIKNEREYMRQRQNDDLGAVILSSEMSDPTAREAIENVYIEDIVLNGNDISELTHDMKYGEKRVFHRQFYILEKMQEEYTILQTQLFFLNSNEKKILELYTESGHDFQKIADQEGIQIESARRRVWEIRKKIKSKVVCSMTEKI